jgi:hypothetical protein
MTHHYAMSEEHKQRLRVLKKNVPRTEEERKNIGQGLKNSVKYKQLQEHWRLVRELKQHVKDAKRRELETRRLQTIAMKVYFDSLKVGPSFTHTREGLERIKEANRGRTPWNKGVEAWNKNRKWPIEVKQNISRGMVVYWIQKKEHHHQQMNAVEAIDFDRFNSIQ